MRNPRRIGVPLRIERAEAEAGTVGAVFDEKPEPRFARQKPGGAGGRAEQLGFECEGGAVPRLDRGGMGGGISPFVAAGVEAGDQIGGGSGSESERDGKKEMDQAVHLASVP